MTAVLCYLVIRRMVHLAYQIKFIVNLFHHAKSLHKPLKLPKLYPAAMFSNDMVVMVMHGYNAPQRPAAPNPTSSNPLLRQRPAPPAEYTNKRPREDNSDQNKFGPPLPATAQSYGPPLPQTYGTAPKLDSYGPPLPQNQGSYGPPLPQNQGSFGPPLPQNQGSFGPPLPQNQNTYGPPIPDLKPYGPAIPSYGPPLPISIKKDDPPAAGTYNTFFGQQAIMSPSVPFSSFPSFTDNIIKEVEVKLPTNTQDPLSQNPPESSQKPLTKTLKPLDRKYIPPESQLSKIPKGCNSSIKRILAVYNLERPKRGEEEKEQEKILETVFGKQRQTSDKPPPVTVSKREKSQDIYSERSSHSDRRERPDRSTRISEERPDRSTRTSEERPSEKDWRSESTDDRGRSSHEKKAADLKHDLKITITQDVPELADLPGLNLEAMVSDIVDQSIGLHNDPKPEPSLPHVNSKSSSNDKQASSHRSERSQSSDHADRSHSDRSHPERVQSDRSQPDRSHPERVQSDHDRSRSERVQSERSHSGKPHTERSHSDRDRSHSDRSTSERSHSERSHSDRKSDDRHKHDQPALFPSFPAGPPLMGYGGAPPMMGPHGPMGPPMGPNMGPPMGPPMGPHIHPMNPHGPHNMNHHMTHHGPAMPPQAHAPPMPMVQPSKEISPTNNTPDKRSDDRSRRNKNPEQDMNNHRNPHNSGPNAPNMGPDMRPNMGPNNHGGPPMGFNGPMNNFNGPQQVPGFNRPQMGPQFQDGRHNWSGPPNNGPQGHQNNGHPNQFNGPPMGQFGPPGLNMGPHGNNI